MLPSEDEISPSAFEIHADAPSHKVFPIRAIRFLSNAILSGARARDTKE